MSTRLGHTITAPSIREAFMEMDGAPLSLNAFDFDRRTPVMTCPVGEIAGFFVLPVAQLHDGRGHAFHVHGVVGVNRGDAQGLVSAGHKLHASASDTYASRDFFNTQEFEKTRGVRAEIWARTPIENPHRAALARAAQNRAPGTHI